MTIVPKMQNKKLTDATRESKGRMTPEEIMQKIPVEKYKDYNNWLAIAGLCKAAGFPFDVFHEWSKGDSEKYESEESCKSAWQLTPHETSEEAYEKLLKRTENNWTLPVFNPLQAITDASTIIHEIHPDLSFALSLGDKKGINRNAEISQYTEEELQESLTELSCMDDDEDFEGIYWQLNKVKLSEKNSVRAENVKTFTWALLESDALPLEEQYRLLRSVPLPLFAGIHSGGKSIHALIHIGADNAEEYRKRTALVYRYAKSYGISADENCKSLGRWSRYPLGRRKQGYQYPVFVIPDYLHFDEWYQKYGIQNLSLDTESSDTMVTRNIPLAADDRKGKKPAVRFHHVEEFISKIPGAKGEIKYNELTKKLEVSGFPWIETPPGYDMTRILADELCALMRPKYTGCSYECMVRLINAIGYSHSYNPVKDTLEDVQWDGVDRISAVCNTLSPLDDFSRMLVKKWLIQCWAMLNNTEGSWGSEGILRLQGPEGIGKTSFFRYLTPIPETCFLSGIAIDTDDRDSVRVATSHWIVEIGECDHTTKKHQALLKGFITKGKDSYRHEYETQIIDHPRMTSYCATVNTPQFLTEGENRRWWLIPVTNIDLPALREIHKEIWQLWAQIKREWEKDNNAFRLNEDEMKILIGRNKPAQENIKYEVEIEEFFDWEAAEEEWNFKSRREIRGMVDENFDANLFGRALTKISKKHNLATKKVRGVDMIRVPPQLMK